MHVRQFAGPESMTRVMASIVVSRASTAALRFSIWAVDASTFWDRRPRPASAVPSRIELSQEPRRGHPVQYRSVLICRCMSKLGFKRIAVTNDNDQADADDLLTRYQHYYL